jgi:uncharacterized protein (DUF2141 family)
MRAAFISLLILLAVPALLISQNGSTHAACCTLTIVVEGMDSSAGNLGVLVFNNEKGWAEDRTAAFKDIAVPAQQGTQTLKVPDLPPGKYAVALIHDVNQNHKIDKNWIGMPKEQWGMSNNPHATIKAPPMSKATFELTKDMEIHITLQK